VGTDDFLEVLVNDGLNHRHISLRGLFELVHFHEVARIDAFGNGKFQFLALGIRKYRELEAHNVITGFGERIHERHILAAPMGIWEIFYRSFIEKAWGECHGMRIFKGRRK
jgi:hypothetical protein